MTRQRWRLVTVLGLCVLGIPTIFLGEVTVNRLPEGPHLVGESIFVEVEADDPTGEYGWDWRCSGNPPGDWIAELFQDSEFFDIYPTRVGNHEDRFWAKEQPDPYGSDPPVWNSKIVPDTIIGPDGDAVASGLDVDSTDEEVEVRFDVLFEETSIGPYIDGEPQEKLIIHNYMNNMFYNTGWFRPKTGQYYWDEPNPQIVDIKQFTMSGTVVQGKPVGTVMADVYHRNRLVIKDCSGTDQYFEFSVHHFQQIKTGDETWKLVEVQPQ